MTDATHTPEPWVAKPCRSDKIEIWSDSGDGSAMTLVAVVPDTRMKPPGVALHDARLLAAAPALLEALEEATQTLENASWTHNDGLLNCAIEEARAVIKLAKS